MNLNLLVSMLIGVGSLVCWLATYFFVIRNMNKPNRCVSRTNGKVIRYSSINYSGIHIPLVSYQVDGKEYRIAGPKFKGSMVKTSSTPFEDTETEMETNLTTREELPDFLIVRARQNSFLSMTYSPLLALYPIGSDVDVYYNPKKPKDAFVQRHEGYNKVLLILFVSLGILLTLGALFILFGPQLEVK